MIQLNLAMLTFALATLVPLATGLIAHWSASSRTKAVLSFFLTMLAAFIAVLIHGGGILTERTVVTFALAYITNIVSYQGFWRPTGIAGAVHHAGDAGIFKDPAVIEMAERTDGVWYADLLAEVKAQLESGAIELNKNKNPK